MCEKTQGSDGMTIKTVTIFRKSVFKSVLLAMIITVAVSFSAKAEYQKYRLKDIEPDFAMFCSSYPLDAHNAIVIANSIYGRPWHAIWYRDGQLYRDLTGTEFLTGMQPVIGEETCFSMLWSIRTSSSQISQGAEGSETVRNEICLGQWTENGLEHGVVLTVPWRGPFFYNSLIIYCEEDCCRLVLKGKEHILRGDVCDSIRDGLSNVYPLGEDVFLFQKSGIKNHKLLICVDQGVEKYRISVPNAYFLFPDGQGGFLCPEGYSQGDYPPQKLLHYDPDGQLNRVLNLQGYRVIAKITESFFDKTSRMLTLYGTAIANSRKVYSVFAMTVDAGMNIRGLDVRNIDPAYHDYSPRFYLAPDGTAYVFICDLNEKPTLHPVLIPFSILEHYGLSLQ